MGAFLLSINYTSIKFILKEYKNYSVHLFSDLKHFCLIGDNYNLQLIY